MLGLSPSIAAALVVLSLFIGVTLGTFGGGGAILAVPVFTYVVGMPAREAIGASLFIIGLSSWFGVFLRRGRGEVRWRPALMLAVFGAVGAWVGQRVGAKLPETVLMLIFAGIMVASASKMVAGAAPQPRQLTGPRGAVLLGALGLGVGVLTGLVGAGGGFLIVPGLVLLAGLPMPSATATSLVVIGANTLSSLATYLTHDTLDWPVVALSAGMAFAGTLAGTVLARRLPVKVLQRGFGVLILGIAALVVVEELVV